jgi:hypothetical protein
LLNSGDLEDVFMVFRHRGGLCATGYGFQKVIQSEAIVCGIKAIGKGGVICHRGVRRASI